MDGLDKSIVPPRSTSYSLLPYPLLAVDGGLTYLVGAMYPVFGGLAGGRAVACVVGREDPCVRLNTLVAVVLGLDSGTSPLIVRDVAPRSSSSS